MNCDYDACLAETLEQEGGYSNDPGDPGGPTKYGITIWDVRLYVNPHATAADVKALTLDQAKAIYKSKYWDAVSGDELPQGVDFAVFDYGVNSGIHRAAMVLQRLVGVPDDGVIGPVTLAATAKFAPADLGAKIWDERLRFLQSLHTWPLFGRGWGRRCVEGKALTMKLAMTEAKVAA